MRLFKENLLVQFSTVSFVVMLALAVAISMVITTKLDNNIGKLKDHGAAMMAGQMIKPTDNFSIPSLTQAVYDLQWTTFGAIGVGFVVLYASLVTIVWRGFGTINRQRTALAGTNEQMQAMNEDLQTANKELHEAQDKLVRNERLAAIGQLSAGVAHELRNPLGGIKNAAFYLKGKLKDSDVAKDNPKIVQFLDIMDEEVTSANQIITDLMDFARVNPPHLTPASLDVLVDNALSRMEIKETTRVKKNFEPDLPEVLADGEQLRRAIANLIKNADEAMPEGGELTVAASARNGVVEMLIHDTGGGIANENVTKVFDPLFTTKTKGIGLGLAIVGEVIQKHNGTIDVASAPGEGTTFTVKLPKALADGNQGPEAGE